MRINKLVGTPKLTLNDEIFSVSAVRIIAEIAKLPSTHSAAIKSWSLYSISWLPTFMKGGWVSGRLKRHNGRGRQSLQRMDGWAGHGNGEPMV